MGNVQGIGGGGGGVVGTAVLPQLLAQAWAAAATATALRLLLARDYWISIVVSQ